MTILFAGGEDTELYSVLGGAVVTTAGKFRSNARCALKVAGNSAAYWQNRPELAFSSGNFWSMAMHIIDSTGGTSTSNNQRLIAWLDSSFVERLGIYGTGNTSQYKVVKTNAAGTTTQIGSAFTMAVGGSLDKIDVHAVISATGSVDVYLNGVVVFTSGTVDTTTDGVTSLANVRLANAQSLAVNGTSDWSEIVVDTTDTRSYYLQTLAPVANGNTHNFDTGTPAAANVNETTLNDATLDGSTTAGQIDQYTIPSLMAGTVAIIAIGVSARMQKGTSGPSKMDLGVRSGGSDFWSADVVLAAAWASAQNWWTTDPNTSAAWAALPSNIGLKSVT